MDAFGFTSTPVGFHDVDVEVPGARGSDDPTVEALGPKYTYQGAFGTLYPADIRQLDPQGLQRLPSEIRDGLTSVMLKV